MSTSLPSGPSASPPLLRLSPSTRTRIYRFVGLAPWDALRPYVFRLNGNQLSYRSPRPRTFHGLLLSCRAIHAEAAVLLYSANRFVLEYASFDPGSLRPLHTLTVVSLRSLSCLKIVHNEASCHSGYPYDDVECCFSGRGRHFCQESHGHRGLLLACTREGDPDELIVRNRANSTLADWQAVATRLAETKPGRLALSLVCDIDPRQPRALQAAQSVVAPILGLPASHLRECNIRLAKTADARLQQVAKDAVVHACGLPLFPFPPSKPPAADGPTLANLPRELRIRILEYTDLVTPGRQINWSREDHAYCIFPRSGLLDSGLPSNDPAAQFFECWYGTSRCGGPPAIGCFCRRRHAAFSVACKCWAPPGPALFLLNRAICEDARFVFFSSNRFILFDFRIDQPWDLPGFDNCINGRPLPRYPYPFGRLGASLFLRDIVPHSALGHLRFLGLVFPAYRPPSWPEAQHPAMQDWWDTVEWLRGKVNAPALTLRLIVARTGSPSSPGYWATISDEEAGTIMDAYTNLMQPLVPLAEEDGLARFYACLVHPRKHTRAGQLGAHRPEWFRVEEQALKQYAERFVMGARYESLYADGREEPGHDDWRLFFYYMC